jgi:hypothetical protein
MTPSQIRTSALQELRVLAAGEPIDPDDDVLVRSRYDALYELLHADNLVSWSSTDDVPEGASTAVIWMLAYLCCTPFGIELQRVQELREKGGPPGSGSLAERILRRLASKAFIYTPIRTVSY